MDTRFDDLEGKVDELTIIAIDNRERIKDCATKDELRETKNRLLTAVEGIAKKQKDTDQELIMHVAAYDRIEEKIKVINKTLAI